MVDKLNKKMLPDISYDIWTKFKIMSSYKEGSYLYYMASKGGNILEIGTGPGGSSLLMAHSMIEHKVAGFIDTIEYELNEVEVNRRKGRQSKFPELLERIKVHFGMSKDLADSFPDKHFDFIYVDGDHSYESVVSDIVKYTPKLKESGVLAFHDTNQDSVMKAIKDTMEATMVAEIDRIKGYTNVRLHSRDDVCEGRS